MRLIRSSWKWFLEALFPPKCLICRCEGSYLCEKHDTFQPAPPSEADFNFVDRIFSATHYFSSPAQQCIEFFKFRGFKEIGEIMAREMLQKAPSHFFKDATLVPIPLHWTREFWRGFNQSSVLAQEIAIYTSTPISKNLKRIRRTAQQARLSKPERLKNLKNAFVWTGILFRKK